MDWTLRRHPGFRGVRGPVVVCIMDGVGIGRHPTDMVSLHLRSGTRREDARAIINLALDQIAEERSLQSERDSVRALCENEEGEDEVL